MKKKIAIKAAAVLAIAAFSAAIAAAVVFNMTGAYGPSRIYAQEKILSNSEEAAFDTFQNIFRKVSKAVLPSVVRIDVVSTQKAPAMRFGQGFPWDFFFNRDNNNTPEEGQEREYKTGGLGSGFVVGREGNNVYVLTNNHVAGKDTTKISIEFSDGRRFDAKLVGADERKDLSMIVATVTDNDNDIQPMTLGDSDALVTGDWVMAVGSPFGFDFSVTSGIVSAKGRSGGPGGNINDFIQTDAAINQGNSGGPLVNMNGEVVGINTWIATQSGGSIGLGFSVPINNVKSALDDLKSGRTPVYGWLGVSVMDVRDLGGADYAASAGFKQSRGALIMSVFKGSPADTGGLAAGDLVLAIDGKPVEGRDRLVYLVGEIKAGTTAQFSIIREGSPIEVRVKVDARKDEKTVDSQAKDSWPGAVVLPLTDDMKKELKLNAKTSGVFIANVTPKTSMSLLQQGDIITAINGKAIASVKDYYSALNNKQANGRYRIEFLRDGQKGDIGVHK